MRGVAFEQGYRSPCNTIPGANYDDLQLLGQLTVSIVCLFPVFSMDLNYSPPSTSWARKQKGEYVTDKPSK